MPNYSDDSSENDQWDEPATYKEETKKQIDPELIRKVATIVKHIFYKCDSRQMGQVRYVLARPYLVDGYKHMQKLVGDKLQGADLYLNSLFPPLTEAQKKEHDDGDQRYIKAQQACTLILDFWDEKFINFIEPQVLQAYSTDNRYILCIGSPIDSGIKDQKLQLTVKTKTTAADEIPPETDYHHCQQDFKFKIDASRKKALYMPKVQVVDSPILLEKSISKEQLLNLIYTNTKRAVEL